MERLLQQIAIHFATTGANDNRCHVLMKGSEAPNVKNGARLLENEEMSMLEKMFSVHIQDRKYYCDVHGALIHFEASSYQSADKFKRWVVFEKLHFKELESVFAPRGTVENVLRPVYAFNIPHQQQTLLFTGADDSITFKNGADETLKLLSSGEILVGGKAVCKDIEVVEALKKFLQIKS